MKRGDIERESERESSECKKTAEIVSRDHPPTHTPMQCNYTDIPTVHWLHKVLDIMLLSAHWCADRLCVRVPVCACGETVWPAVREGMCRSIISLMTHRGQHPPWQAHCRPGGFWWEPGWD